MQVSGDYTFDAPQDMVWQALQDPNVLAQVMPGGEEFHEVGENEYEGVLNIKVGPVQGRFNGNIRLTDVNPPDGYHMEVDGRGAPGFVKAGGNMRLRSENGQTHLEYEGEARVGGRIASVGQRLLESSARSIIRQSLEGLDAYLQAQQAAAEVEETVQAQGKTATEARQAAAAATRPVYSPPSQTEVAFNIAKDVYEDMVPEEYRPLVVAGVVLLLLLVLSKLLGGGD